MSPLFHDLQTRLAKPENLHSAYDLSTLLFYRIGGPAEILLKHPTDDQIPAALAWAAEKKVKTWVLGAGTNLLVADRGLPGLAIYLGPHPQRVPQILGEDNQTLSIRVSSQFPKANLLDWALERGIVGLEFSAGIPGTMGGAVYMNAGTKWGSYAEAIEKVRLFSLEKGVFERTREEMGFRYRGHGEGLLDGETLVLSVDMKLKKASAPDQLQESRRTIDEILRYRGERQPLDFPSCGSVFKNPENSPKGAGRLIEASGLKGRRSGQAVISDKHANFILNLGGAKARDVDTLIALVQEVVKKDHGVDLHPEVIRLGF